MLTRVLHEPESLSPDTQTANPIRNPQTQAAGDRSPAPEHNLQTLSPKTHTLNTTSKPQT